MSLLGTESPNFFKDAHFGRREFRHKLQALVPGDLQQRESDGLRHGLGHVDAQVDLPEQHLRNLPLAPRLARQGLHARDEVPLGNPGRTGHLLADALADAVGGRRWSSQHT